MTYNDFYDIAVYGNYAWNGQYTLKEIACNAYNYMCDFLASKKQGEFTEMTKELYHLLLQDGSEQCIDWSDQLLAEVF